MTRQKQGTHRKRILLFNDNAKRDLLGLRLLERALQHGGFTTAICNFHNAKVKLRLFRPHALLAARGDCKIAREAAKVCRVYIVPGEGAPVLSDDRNPIEKLQLRSIASGRRRWVESP